MKLNLSHIEMARTNNMFMIRRMAVFGLYANPFPSVMIGISAYFNIITQLHFTSITSHGWNHLERDVVFGN